MVSTFAKCPLLNKTQHCDKAHIVKIIIQIIIIIYQKSTKITFDQIRRHSKALPSIIDNGVQTNDLKEYVTFVTVSGSIIMSLKINLDDIHK